MNRIATTILPALVALGCQGPPLEVPQTQQGAVAVSDVCSSSGKTGQHCLDQLRELPRRAIWPMCTNEKVLGLNMTTIYVQQEVPRLRDDHGGEIDWVMMKMMVLEGGGPMPISYHRNGVEVGTATLYPNDVMPTWQKAAGMNDRAAGLTVSTFAHPDVERAIGQMLIACSTEEDPVLGTIPISLGDESQTECDLCKLEIKQYRFGFAGLGLVFGGPVGALAGGLVGYVVTDALTDHCAWICRQAACFKQMETCLKLNGRYPGRGGGFTPNAAQQRCIMDYHSCVKWFAGPKPD